ncbi:MAG: hypothetical protein A3F12_01095 [Gammaproteobacteria bacterium RIFCSPHIGHO2_12_FULL_38_14]|nr:MAG: hypothetical protein A3F12_01095 [Gammaproteobacteria bacterium RIFCSPHIGHO2_12_FULL_38_14]
MRLNNTIIRYFVLIFSLFYFANVTHAASFQNDPIALLQHIADNMIAGLKANKATLKSKPQVVYRLARQYVVPYADLNAMSQRVLPPATWNSATPAERAQFKQLFTTTLIRTYASALTSYQDQTIQFFPIRGNYQGRQSVVVNSEISGSNQQSIRVSYRLLNQNGSWRLYDMSVEGVSMLESFRSQFSDILSRGNMSELLNRMQQHTRGRE